MNPTSPLALIPRPVRVIAWIILGLAVVGAVAVLVRYALSGEISGSPFISLAFLFGGLFLATWLLGLGYVYADARRRAMRPVLWVLVAFFFPHLLGFLLYFVLRAPLTTACPQCRNAIAAGQRFCSWCGHPQLTPAAPPAPAANPF